MQLPRLGNIRAALSTTTPRHWVHGVLLVGAMGIAVAHQLRYRDWYIEDAAISFAYANHLAIGEGLVPYPGGERVEGYSNPTWVLLMAIFELFGVDGFTSSKVMAGVLAALTVPMVYAIARYAREKLDEVPLIAAFVLAANSQFAIWGASGLENSLVSFLMAAGVWRTLSEGRRNTFPWSALIFFFLAISRPEAIMYAAIGGGAAMVFTLANGRGLMPTVKWLAVFWLPFLGYHAARWAYFAWPLPNTYYAKLGDSDPAPWNWDGRGWKYVRRYASFMGMKNKEPGLGVVYYFPAWILGVTGARGWRLWAALTLCAAVALVMLYPIPEDLTDIAWLPAFEPGAVLTEAGVIDRSRDWLTARPIALCVVAIVAPLIAFGHRRWRAAVLCWFMLVASVFFAMWSNGDWMKGYRWFSISAVPMAVLLAIGAGEIADIADRWLTWAAERLGVSDSQRVALYTLPVHVFLLSAVAGSATTPRAHHADWYDGHRETGPFSVRKRVNYMNYVRRRLHLESVTGMDVDMGAHMWWSGWKIVDMAGLIDVPIAHHDYQKPFMREWVHKERKPEFAHVHSSWANKTKIPQHPEWRRDYVEIPGYPSGKKSVHGGNHVRRDLLIESEWSGPPYRSVTLEQGVTIEGWSIPHTTAAPGGHVYVELGLSTNKRNKDKGFRVLMFLASRGEVRHTWSLAPGYDWLMPGDWKIGEVFHGRYSLQVPAKLAQQTYDVGFVVLGPDGTVLQPLEQIVDEATAPDDADEEPEVVFARGEMIHPQTLTLVGAKDVANDADTRLAEALDLAAEGKCTEAETAWRLTWLRMTRRWAWQDRRRPRVKRAIAECWVGVAAAAEDRDDKIWALGEAWNTDHNAPSLAGIADPVADALIAEGRAQADIGRAAGVARRGECDELTASIDTAAGRAGTDWAWWTDNQARIDGLHELCGVESEDDEPELETIAWEAAYRSFSAALRIDATRSWARRWAEEARDRRLGLDPETIAREEAERDERRRQSKERAEKARKEREERTKEQEEGSEVEEDSPTHQRGRGIARPPTKRPLREGPRLRKPDTEPPPSDEDAEP